MPLSAAALGLIGTGLEVGSGIFNAVTQGRQNRINRKWQENMYFQQRRDSLADWHMMNAYNSPAAQMGRFKEAGLNPNLIYGQTNTGATVRSSDAPSSNAPAPRVDFSRVGSSLMMGYEIESRKAATDNLRAALEVAREEVQLKKAQTANTAMDSAMKATDRESKEFFLDQARRLSPIVVEAAELENRKREVEIEAGTYGYLIRLREDARAARLTDQSLKKGVEEILTLRVNRAKTEQERRNLVQALENLKSENYGKDLANLLESMEAEARTRGYSWKDPQMQRLAMELLTRLVEGRKATDSVIDRRREALRRVQE